MIDVKVVGAKELLLALDRDAKRLPRELSIAINATARKIRTNVSKQIREELAARSKDVKRAISIKRKSSKASLVSVVELKKEQRLSLKAFSPRQTRKGVTYRSSPKAGRRTVPRAFMGPKPGVKAPRLNGHVFKRTGRGRTPITKLEAASPWGAYVKNRMKAETVRVGNQELAKQIKRRINFINYKAHQRRMQGVS